MPTVHYTKLIPSAWAATTSQAGYGPENLGIESIGRPWRATTTGANDITITLPAVAMIQTLFLHDVNFAAATVQKSVDGVVWTAAPAFTSYADDNGRRRGALAVATAGLKALKVQIANGASTDGLAYWCAGAAYLFGASAALPVAPRIGYSVKTRRAVISVELPNNQIAQARTGLDVDVIDLPFERKFDQSLQTLVEKAKAGTVVLTMDLADWPAQQWPVRYVAVESAENYFRVHKAQRAVELREVI